MIQSVVNFQSLQSVDLQWIFFLWIHKFVDNCGFLSFDEEEHILISQLRLFFECLSITNEG